VASLQQLQDDVLSYLNRQDVVNRIPSWVLAVETELAQTLRARCQVTSAYQNIDQAYIPLPSDFATMESIRNSDVGDLLDLQDEWSGSWTNPQQDDRNTTSSIWYNPTPPKCTAYRLVANCIEFLPHPVIPDPPDPTWVPQQVLMGWYSKPKPLLLPSDTNPILEQLYTCYLWGMIKQGAMFELDDDRVAQADAAWQQAITRANLAKQQSDYSGAPFKELMACQF
jgi:hypothetical protein